MRASTLLLLASMGVGAACGGGGAKSPSGAGPESVADAAAASGSATATATVTDAGTATAMDAGTTAAPVIGPMNPPRPSQMLADLQAIGLDAKNLPPLAKLEPEKLRKVMKLFARSLGVKCAGCHAEAMETMTPRKRVAIQMWNHFVRGMAMGDDSPLFCDSCHQGSVHILDRRNKKATEKWMDDNFVGKLQRKDGQENDCATCHGEEVEDHFIDLWKQGKPFP
jgi:hypothetical protein